jgi:hypothetical protein
LLSWKETDITGALKFVVAFGVECIGFDF